jgi:UDP-3-O-acyl-N-acetylglucosamine deacetylase
VEQEAVKHKILDLLGDLALLGLKLPRLRLLVRNGGHALNHLLLERLQHE